MSESNPYDAVIMDHIRNTRHYRILPDASHRAAGISPLCGDEMTVYAKIEHDRIRELGFQCSCCGISMASASIMTDVLKALKLADARALVRAFLTVLDSGAEAGAHGIDGARLAILQTVRALPSRRKCAALPWLTLEAALDGRAQAVATDS
jgi:nitrogen fixation NifU-like protein